MNVLKNAVKAAQTDLGSMYDQGVNLYQPLVILERVLAVSDLVTSIQLARDACEAIIDRAHVAEDVGGIDLAERLRGVNRMLSPVVAGLYRTLHEQG